MGGVSITESAGGGYDAASILSGGKDFLDRLQQFTDAKNAADQAYERLGLGQDVAAEMNKSALMAANAKIEADGIVNQAMQDAAAKQKSLGEFIARTRDEAAADRQAAAELKAAAEQDRAAAADLLADAARKNADADARLASINAKEQAFAAAAAVLSKASGT
jgi:hypothetical protein